MTLVSTQYDTGIDIDTAWVLFFLREKTTRRGETCPRKKEEKENYNRMEYPINISPLETLPLANELAITNSQRLIFGSQGSSLFFFLLMNKQMIALRKEIGTTSKGTKSPTIANKIGKRKLH